jgi:hypothetical protein
MIIDKLLGKVIHLCCLFIIVGCFLPWFGEGDAIFYRTYGIEISWTIVDNGGLFIILLSIIELLIIYKVRILSLREVIISFSPGLLLTLTALFHLYKFLYMKPIMENTFGKDIIGDPQPLFGIYIIIICSIMIIIFTLIASKAILGKK